MIRWMRKRVIFRRSLWLLTMYLLTSNCGNDNKQDNIKSDFGIKDQEVADLQSSETMIFDIGDGFFGKGDSKGEMLLIQDMNSADKIKDTNGKKDVVANDTTSGVTINSICNKKCNLPKKDICISFVTQCKKICKAMSKDVESKYMKGCGYCIAESFKYFKMAGMCFGFQYTYPTSLACIPKCFKPDGGTSP